MSQMVLYCSFCGKAQHEVMCLIAGPTVFICNECTALCSDIAFDHRVVKALERLQPAIRWALENPEAVLRLRDGDAASGIEAPSGGETTEIVSTEGESPTVEDGDAQ